MCLAGECTFVGGGGIPGGLSHSSSPSSCEQDLLGFSFFFFLSPCQVNQTSWILAVKQAWEVSLRGCDQALLSQVPCTESKKSKKGQLL